MDMPGQCVQKLVEILWHGCRPLTSSRILRMRDFEMARMQSLAGKVRQRPGNGIPHSPGSFPVHRVSDHRKSQVGHVHPDLVGSSSFKLYIQQRA